LNKVLIRELPGKDFKCPHCGALYEVYTLPARDTGSATCDVCDQVMVRWNQTAIPSFWLKRRADDVLPQKQEGRAAQGDAPASEEPWRGAQRAFLMTADQHRREATLLRLSAAARRREQALHHEQLVEAIDRRQRD
jgi:transcription elongation factor Elf1